MKPVLDIFIAASAALLCMIFAITIVVLTAKYAMWLVGVLS